MFFPVSKFMSASELSNQCAFRAENRISQSLRRRCGIGEDALTPMLNPTGNDVMKWPLE